MKICGALFVLISCAILGNGQNSVSFLEPNCGVSISSRSSSRRSSRSSPRGSKYRIVGGGKADMYGNPWMAFIRNSVECGGSLITARFVLSAAHCITGSPTTVYLGEYDMSRRTANAIQVPTDLQIPHRHYSHNDSQIKNDIGLFRLAWAVTYTDYIRPVCLPTNYNPLARTTNLTATGWGKTEHGVGSNVLKTTTLTQLNRGTCSSTFGSHVDVSQICAGAPNSHTCRGDSGGPITAKYSIGGMHRVVQLGIVSYGEAFCRTVGVYTNVMHFMGWIANVVRMSGSQASPAPTQRPKNPANNRVYYVYPNSYYPSGNSPIYYYPNGNSPVYYYPANYVING